MKQLACYMHGVNLGAWLSQCEDTKVHYDTFITKDDLKTIRSWGADHVRVPVDYVLVETEEGVTRKRALAISRRPSTGAGNWA